MIISSSTKEYSVLFYNTTDSLNCFKPTESDFFVIDEKVMDLYPNLFSSIPQNKLFTLKATEERKVIDTALQIIDRLVSMSAKRNARLISVGGGITQDVTGFAANIIYRGISWTFVPTTLLAACDSCIGGKTSLNYKSYKNLLGTFFPPNKILICPEFFNTLSKADLLSGLGEVVKFNVMAGSESLANLEQSMDDLLALKPETVCSFVKQSLMFKKEIIEEDEFDCGKRVLLNFAHTFGHAYEVSSEYFIPHGTAVALGMIAANSISVKRGILSLETASRIENLVGRILPNIPSSLFNYSTILSAIRKDKKQIGDCTTAVLLDDSFTLHVLNDVKDSEIFESTSYIIDYLESGSY